MTEKEFDETTLWTPANIVTLVRILLVPVFVVAIISLGRLIYRIGIMPSSVSLGLLH